MKTLTPKSLVEEKQQKVDSGRFIHIFLAATNIATLIVAVGVMYMLRFPVEHKFNTGYCTSQLRELGLVNNGLEDIKTQIVGLKKTAAAGNTPYANCEVMSKSYNIQLLTNAIRSKIISGDDFKIDLQELEKFGISAKDFNFQALQKYSSGEGLRVNVLIASLYDEATTNNKALGNESFMDSVKHFFSNLFVVKKVDEHKVHATSNEITSIIVQLLLDGKVEAAYTVANKFHGVNASITGIADRLEPANEALTAVSKLEVYG